MDDLLRDFVVETVESIDVVDNQLVRFEREPNNKAIIDQIFRLVHTIKGTCGFLGLPRLEQLTHAAESALDRFRGGAPVTRDAVTLILSTIDRIKLIMAELDRAQTEPDCSDGDLIDALDHLTLDLAAAESRAGPSPHDAHQGQDFSYGTLVYQVLERPLRPGEASLDELERAFRETGLNDGEDDPDEDMDRLASAMSPTVHDRSRDEQQETAPDLTLKASTIRVPVETLEHLMTMVSELVLTRNQLLEIARRDESGAYKVPLQRLSHVTAELQDSVMKTRMQPIGSAWSKLPRLIRDLSNELGKDIALSMSGAETEIDRQLLDLIRDPMVHMIRNAADHGIETPAERLKFGKSPRGEIRVGAAQEGGYIILTVADDGRGLDLKRIRAKAVRLGLCNETEAARLTDTQAARFIFHPGFSTAEQLTSISGRGVGMDVVRSNIEQMGGSVDVRTTAGQGTAIDIKIPLTLAIAAALIVEVAGHRFAVPQTSILELVRPNGGSEARIEQLNQTPVLRLRDRLLPLIQLSQVLRLSSEQAIAENAYIVVCQIAGVRFGVVVDGVLQTEEIVVKPVSQQLRHLAVFSGSTILGDGSVIMILDPGGLVESIGTLGEAHNDNIAGASEGAIAAADRRSTLLVFKAGAGAPKAVPLPLVTRLEEIEIARIETAGGQMLVQYRGRLMRLIKPDDDMQMRETGNQPVIVFAHGPHVVGVMVDEIIDIVDEELDVALSGARPGIVGSAVLRGRATDIVDVPHFVPEFGQSDSRRSAQKSVLLVEPSEFMKAMLSPVLQAAGYRVSHVASVEQAVGLMATRPADVVVVGLDDSKALTLAEKGTPGARYVGLVSQASPDLLEDAASAGFEDVIGYFDREGLLGCLARMFDDLEEAA